MSLETTLYYLLQKTIYNVAMPRFWPAEDYHQKYLEKGGQGAKKGCLDPIKCYG